jgi:hypothetical protein
MDSQCSKVEQRAPTLLGANEQAKKRPGISEDVGRFCILAAVGLSERCRACPGTDKDDQPTLGLSSPSRYL